MSDEIPLRCYFAATKSTRSQMASAVTVHAATRPRAVAIVVAIFVAVAAVLVGLHPDEPVRWGGTAVGITVLAVLVEAGRAWIAAYRSLGGIAAAGTRTQSGFARDRFLLHSAEGDEVQHFDDLAAVQRRGPHVMMRTRSDGQRWFVFPRALFPDAEVERIRTAIKARTARAAPALAPKPTAKPTAKPAAAPQSRATPPAAAGGFTNRRPETPDVVPPILPVAGPPVVQPAPRTPAPFRRPPTFDPPPPSRS